MKPRKIRVNGFDELVNNEKKIIKRINETLNGGQLFLADPLQMLHEVGVELDEKAQGELLARNRSIQRDSCRMAFNALKRSQVPQNVRIHLKGLFKKDGAPSAAPYGLGKRDFMAGQRDQEATGEIRLKVPTRLSGKMALGGKAAAGGKSGGAGETPPLNIPWSA